jgi:hypothetical protein
MTQKVMARYFSKKEGRVPTQVAFLASEFGSDFISISGAGAAGGRGGAAGRGEAQ